MTVCIFILDILPSRTFVTLNPRNNKIDIDLDDLTVEKIAGMPYCIYLAILIVAWNASPDLSKALTLGFLPSPY